jgi:hypothetical protein
VAIPRVYIKSAQDYAGCAQPCRCFPFYYDDPQMAAIKAELKWLAGELSQARELEVLVSRVAGPMKRQRRRWGGIPSHSHELAEWPDAARTPLLPISLDDGAATRGPGKSLYVRDDYHPGR